MCCFLTEAYHLAGGFDNGKHIRVISLQLVPKAYNCVCPRKGCMGQWANGMGLFALVHMLHKRPTPQPLNNLLNNPGLV